MKIISFGHRKGVGKDTAARFLLTELKLRYPGIDIKVVGFADKLKDIAYQLFKYFGLQQGDFYERPGNLFLKDIILPGLRKTPRDLWIGVGNNLRVIRDEVWLDYVFRNIVCDIMIIKDLRFPAEAQGILSTGGFIYRIDCPWSPVVADGADDPLEDFDMWTGVINNNADLKHLHDQVIILLERHFNDRRTN